MSEPFDLMDEMPDVPGPGADADLDGAPMRGADDLVVTPESDASSTVVSSEPSQENPPPAVDDAPMKEVIESAPVAEAPADLGPMTDRERMLVAQIEQLSGEKIEASASRPIEIPTSSESPSDHNFLEGEDLDEVFSSAEKFNGLLNKVYNMALDAASQRSASSIMRDLPSTITQYVTQHMELTKTVEKFYAENQDLQPVKRTLAGVANIVASEKPELKLEEVFEEAAKRTRTMLGLTKQVAAPVPPSKDFKRRPAFIKPPTRQNGRSEPVEMVGLAAEVGDLLTGGR